MGVCCFGVQKNRDLHRCGSSEFVDTNSSIEEG